MIIRWFGRVYHASFPCVSSTRGDIRFLELWAPWLQFQVPLCTAASTFARPSCYAPSSVYLPQCASTHNRCCFLPLLCLLFTPPLSTGVSLTQWRALVAAALHAGHGAKPHMPHLDQTSGIPLRVDHLEHSCAFACSDSASISVGDSKSLTITVAGDLKSRTSESGDPATPAFEQRDRCCRLQGRSKPGRMAPRQTLPEGSYSV